MSTGDVAFPPTSLQTACTVLPIQKLVGHDKLDQYECRLVISPNLTSLFTSLGTISGDRCGDPDYDSTVAVACLAPKVRELRVDIVERGPSSARPPRRIEAGSLLGDYRLAKKIFPKDNLQVLELIGNKSGRVPIDKDCLRTRDAAIDFACLARLNLASLNAGAL